MNQVPTSAKDPVLCVLPSPVVCHDGRRLASYGTVSAVMFGPLLPMTFQMLSDTTGEPVTSSDTPARVPAMKMLGERIPRRLLWGAAIYRNSVLGYSLLVFRRSSVRSNTGEGDGGVVAGVGAVRHHSVVGRRRAAAAVRAAAARRRPPQAVCRLCGRGVAVRAHRPPRGDAHRPVAALHGGEPRPLCLPRGLATARRPARGAGGRAAREPGHRAGAAVAARAPLCAGSRCGGGRV